MPTLDQCHEQVVHALQKAGWIVQPASKRLRYEQHIIYIDVEASRQQNGSLEHIILVEVKCFADERSITTDVYTAIDQYLIYRTLLRQMEWNVPLYLALPHVIYETVIDNTVLETLKESKIKVVIVDIELEEVVQWIE